MRPLTVALSLILAFVIVPTTAISASTDSVEDLVLEADRLDLASDAQWLKLLLYERSRWLGGDLTSAVLNDAFFLSVGGRTDPRAELEATLRALLGPTDVENNTHPQCRFPARLAWLKTRLNWPVDTPTASCSDYDEWARNGAITGISVIFASGHLENPASFYGHMLVKFNSPGETITEDLLETTLNYGAAVPTNENGVAYIIKGLVGGYTSTFSHLEFFRQNHNYAETQLRDLWEYELDLTLAEVELIVGHTWELLGMDNRYYFISHNCAYRIAELLNLVVEKPLLPPSKFWAMPVDVFVRLNESKPGERDLVKNVTRFPSRQNRFRDAFRSLTDAEKSAVGSFINDSDGEIEQIMVGHSVQGEIAILETLLEYYTFLEARLDQVPDWVEERKNELLLARLIRPPSTEGDERDQSNVPPLPHMGNKSSLIQMSYIQNNKLGSGVQYRFRAAYYDNLSFAPGRLENAGLSMVDLRVIHRNGHLSVRTFDAVKITTLNLSETGQPYDGGNAWSLRFGLENQNLADDRNLTSLIEGGYGKGWQVDEDLAIFVLGLGRATAFDRENSYAQIGAKLGALIGSNRRWKMGAEIGVWQQLDAVQRTIPYARFETRIGRNSSFDLRLGVEYQSGFETKEVVEGNFAVSYYW